MPGHKIPVPREAILEELTAFSDLAHTRLEGITGEPLERKKTAQLLGLGALWLKWMEKNPTEAKEEYARLVYALAHELKEK